uniref:Uncharacterized protein n=1 Tax=Bubo bubo TaxID=30461 RepID=A0A8C0EZX8_BUBBB
ITMAFFMLLNTGKKCGFLFIASHFLRYHSKTIRFLNVAFDSSGDSLLAGDHQGNIYVFDLNGNSHTGVCLTEV